MATLSARLQKLIRLALPIKSEANALIAELQAGQTSQAAFVAPVATANATDLASAEALANANKVAINAVIASLIASGAMSAS